MRTFDQIYKLNKLHEEVLDLPKVVNEYDEVISTKKKTSPAEAEKLMSKIRPYRALMNSKKVKKIITTPDASADYPKDENVGPPKGFSSYGRWQLNPDDSLSTTGGASGDKNGGHVGHPKIAGYWAKDHQNNLIVRGRMGEVGEDKFLNGYETNGKFVPGHLRTIVQDIAPKVS